MDKQLKGWIFVTNRLIAIEFAKMLNVPFPLITELLCSKEWRAAHKKILAESLKKLPKKGTPK